LPTLIEVLQAASGGGDDAVGAIQMLEAHRRGLARSFLNSAEPEAGLAARLQEVAVLAISGFPWEPIAEDYELAQAILERLAMQPAPAPNVLMAAMALAPAHHFPPPPRLLLVPQWLRPLYARFLLARAPIFLHAGEADRYAAHGALAMAAVRQAIFEDQLPDSDELASATMGADSTLIYFNGQSLKPYFRDKAQIAEWALLRSNHRLGFGFSLHSNAKPRIGVLHRTLAPGTETYHLLAHLEGRDRAAAEVRIYFLDAAPNALTEAFRPWVDEFVQLAGDTGAAVAQIRRDRLDLCFMTNNLGWGLTREAAIAAHRLAKVQVVSGACPATPGFSVSDIFLSSRTNDPTPQAQDDYVERLAFLPGAVGHFAYAHDRDPATLSCARSNLGIPDDHVFFFSGANYYKITPEVLEAWAEILAETPRSSLGLMPFNPNWGGNYPLALFLRRLNRTLARFGVAPSRVRLIGQVPTRADLLAVMGLADVYLDSFPYSGACSLVDPLLVGLPIVECAGTRLRTAQGGSLLRGEDLGDAVCPDVDAYVARAVGLARDRTVRDQARARAIAASSSLSCLRTTPYAKRFERFCLDAISAAEADGKRLLAAGEARLCERIEQAAARALTDPAPAARWLGEADLVLQLFGPYLETLEAEGQASIRVVSIGDAPGVSTWPASAPAVQEQAFAAGQNREAGEAVGSAHLVRIDATQSGFDLLQRLEGSADRPKLVAARFDAALPGQTARELEQIVAAMRARGYAAVLFEHRRAGPAWGAVLADVATHIERLGVRGDGFGTVVFYQAGDTAFLALLADLLDKAGPAPQRGLAGGLDVAAPPVRSAPPARPRPRGKVKRELQGLT
jgi:hypothetical protein